MLRFPLESVFDYENFLHVGKIFFEELQVTRIVARMHEQPRLARRPLRLVRVGDVAKI